MNIYSFNTDVDYGESKIKTKVILETPFSKEIRILFKEGQLMKEHKAPFPIIVHILEGEIIFGVHNEHHTLKKGDIITLESNVPHNLKATKQSTVRLTLSKLDDCARVESVANNR